MCSFLFAILSSVVSYFVGKYCLIKIVCKKVAQLSADMK